MTRDKRPQKTKRPKTRQPFRGQQARFRYLWPAHAAGASYLNPTPVAGLRWPLKIEPAAPSTPAFRMPREPRVRPEPETVTCPTP